MTSVVDLLHGLPFDIFLYQSIFVTLGVVEYFRSVHQEQYSVSAIGLFQIAALCLFFATYSGYSVDTPVYQAILEYYFEYPILESFFLWKQFLFFGPATALAKVLPAPWPVKIMSVAGCLIFSFSLFRIFRKDRDGILPLVLGLALVSPGVLYLFGNGIRQGLACSTVLLGASYLLTRHWIRSSVLIAIGIGLHISSGVMFAFSLVAGVATKRILAIGLLASPLAGYLLFLIYGLDGPAGVHMNYEENSEGSFHTLRLAAAQLIAWIIIVHLPDCGRSHMDRLLRIYIGTVIIASFFVVWETPASRLLLQSDLLLPVVGAFLVSRHRELCSSVARIVTLLVTMIFVGWGLMAAPSTMITLGFQGIPIVYE